MKRNLNKWLLFVVICSFGAIAHSQSNLLSILVGKPRVPLSENVTRGAFENTNRMPVCLLATSVDGLLFGRDEKTIMVARSDGALEEWELASYSKRVLSCGLRYNCAGKIVFTNNICLSYIGFGKGGDFVVCEWLDRFFVFDCGRGDGWLERRDVDPKGYSCVVKMTDDMRIIINDKQADGLFMFDVCNGKYLETMDVGSPGAYFDISPSGNFVLTVETRSDDQLPVRTVSCSGMVRSLSKKEDVRKLFERENMILQPVWVNDQVIAACDASGGLRVWNISDEAGQYRINGGRRKSDAWIAGSHKGDICVSISDGVLEIWDLKARVLKKTYDLQLQSRVSSLVVSPSGRRAGVGCKDGTVRTIFLNADD